jgi:Protein of unknown function (DUF3617)
LDDARPDVSCSLPVAVAVAVDLLEGVARAQADGRTPAHRAAFHDNGVFDAPPCACHLRSFADIPFCESCTYAQGRFHAGLIEGARAVKFFLTLTSVAALSAGALAQALPSAGMWELSIKMEGAPGGGDSKTGKACLAAETLAAAPEKTLMEAAARQASERSGPKCEYHDIKRAAQNTTWQAQCEGPMGKMQGMGGGMLGADGADLQQSFVVKAPIGTLNLKQTVTARRVGDC